MLRFTRGSSLVDEEMQALRQGMLVLDCLEMRLESGSGEIATVYSGPGHIRQDADYNLIFTVYAQQTVSLPRFFDSINSTVLGEPLADEEFFVLSATDTQGRQWTGERLLLDGDTRHLPSGSICRGWIRQLKLQSDLGGEDPGQYMYVEIPGEFRIPPNIYTLVTEEAGNQKQVRRRANALGFTALGCDFLLKQREDRLEVTLTSEEVPPPTT